MTHLILKVVKLQRWFPYPLALLGLMLPLQGIAYPVSTVAPDPNPVHSDATRRQRLPHMENVQQPQLAQQPQPDQQPQSDQQPQPICSQPALDRIIRHTIAPGETLVSLSQRYNLIPATLMGINPILRNETAPVGAEILIPPYNGIRVEVPTDRTWRDIAARYHVRADVLFEVNGCQQSPRVVFVPGVNWSPEPAAQTPLRSPLTGYPLPTTAPILLGYGWQVYPETGAVAFHNGVNLAANLGTPVLTVGAGTIAFAAQQGNYGNLIVINHAEGLQTRYSQLATINVRVGQVVRAGDRIGTVGNSGRADQPLLHFEVRSNSSLGWIAQDPSLYVENMDLAQQ
jgi:murein DD-endopeptidase MepM/ murein hydrolase activator NlpD